MYLTLWSGILHTGRECLVADGAHASWGFCCNVSDAELSVGRLRFLEAPLSVNYKWVCSTLLIPSTDVLCSFLF